MRLKIKNNLPLPVATIYPEGGEPLYEEAGTGIRLTAQDFAANAGYESTKEFLAALKPTEVTTYG